MVRRYYLLAFTKEHLNVLLQASTIFFDIQNNLENTNALRTHFLTQGSGGKGNYVYKARHNAKC